MVQKFREKILKRSRGSRSQLLYWLFVLGIQENSPQKVSAPETCGATRYRPHHAAWFLHFSENFKKASSLSSRKSLMEMRNMKEKILCDLWFSLPDMKVILKQLSEMFLKNSCLWKFMSLKKHLWLNPSMTFLYILQSNEKMVCSIWSQEIEYCNTDSVSSRTNT